MRLSIFINENIETILQEWEDFAVTLESLGSANKVQLRDHARAILAAICLDLDSDQSAQQAIDKSKGNAPDVADETAAESHAQERLLQGFTVEELMAEFRALRASVLRLWQARVGKADQFELQDMVRFNEAIDQSLTESLARFSAMLRDSQNVFLAILGHDVRSPLGAVSMGTQMILQDTTLPARHLKVAAQVLRSTQRVTDIVSDLLDYSTSHLGGGIPVTLAEYDLSAECRSVAQEARLFHPERSFNVEIEDSIVVCWDQARMSQALANLLGNAVQHGASSSPVWLTVSRQAQDVLLIVQNEGAVIAPARLRTMFDPGKAFVMKSNSERSASDTNNLGLGLYITHEIVLAHGGRIWVTSTSREGTTVKMQIPLAAVAPKGNKVKSAVPNPLLAANETRR